MRWRCHLVDSWGDDPDGRVPESRTVKLVIIEGGGADWPGVGRSGPLDASPSATAAPTATVAVPTVGPTVSPDAVAAYNTTARLWEFFKAHER